MLSDISNTYRIQMVPNKQHLITFSLLLAMLLISIGEVWGQQTTIFNQYVYNNFLINPAKAGSVDVDEHRIALGYRTQWLGFGSDRPTAILAAYDGTPFAFGQSNGTQLGIGLTVMNDQAHVVNRTYASLNIAGHVLLGPNLKLSAGIRAGGLNNSYDFTGREIPDPTDPIVLNSNQSDFVMDIGGGLNLNYKTPAFEANIGASSYQLPTDIEISDSLSFLLNTHIIPSARIRFNFSKSEINGQSFYKLGLEPAISYRGILNRNLGGGALDAGLRIHLMDAAWFGGGFRSNGAGYYGSVGVKPMHNFEISGSYEFHAQLGTSFEIGLNYAFGRKKPPVLEARKEQKEIDKAKAAIAKQEAEELKAAAAERERLFKEAKAEAERKQKEEEAAAKEAERLAELAAKKAKEEEELAAKKAKEEAELAAKKAKEEAALAAKKAEEEAKKAEEEAKLAAKKAEDQEKLAAKKAAEEQKNAEAKAKEDARLAEAKAKEEARIAEEKLKAEEKAEKEAERLALAAKKKQEEEDALAAKNAEADAKEKARLAEIERKRKEEEAAALAKAEAEAAKNDPCAAIENRSGILFRQNRMQERADLLGLDFDFIRAGHEEKNNFHVLNYEYSVYQEEYITLDGTKKLINEIVDITKDALNACRLPKMEPDIHEITLYLKLAETKEELDFDSGYSYNGEFGSPATSNYSMDESFETISIEQGGISFEKMTILKLIGLRNTMTAAFKEKGIDIPNSAISIMVITGQDVDQEESKIEIILKPAE